MNRVLNDEDPQLAVLNGDLITGENAFLANSTSCLDALFQPMVDRDIPWASTYGNHDSAFNLSREDIIARERMYPNSLTDQMVHDRNAGVSNYYLLVYPHKDAEMPSLILWFFDSRGGFLYQQSTPSGDQVAQPDWVDQTVVDWFKATRDRLEERYRKTVPSLAFVHIPTNASRAFQTEVGVDPNLQPGINDDNPLAQQAQGWCSDGTRGEVGVEVTIPGFIQAIADSIQTCTYGGQDVSFMEAVVSTPGLLALFSGHDHGDTWCYRWDRKLPGMYVKGNGVSK